MVRDLLSKPLICKLNWNLIKFIRNYPVNSMVCSSGGREGRVLINTAVIDVSIGKEIDY